MKTKQYALTFLFGLFFLSNNAQAQMDVDPEIILPSPCYAEEDLEISLWPGLADPCALQFLYGVDNLYEYYMNGIVVFTMEWNFGDGNSYNTEWGEFPIHSYASPGTYEVCVTYWTTNGVECCKTTTCESFTIEPTVCNLCTAMDDITLSITGTNPFTFTAEGLHPRSLQKMGYLWDFGDGTTGKHNNALHTYVADSTYAVKLTIFYYDETTGACCSREILQRITVGGGLIKLEGEPNSTPITTPDLPLTVYPNPSDGNFILNTSSENSIESIAIFDATGKIVHQTKSYSGRSTEVMNLSHLEKGVYFVIINENSFDKRSYAQFVIE